MNYKEEELSFLYNYKPTENNIYFIVLEFLCVFFFFIHSLVWLSCMNKFGFGVKLTYTG